MCACYILFPLVQKFQKVVEAYVRVQLDPDDCDQMKIKRILMEIYSFHDDIASGLLYLPLDTMPLEDNCLYFCCTCI